MQPVINGDASASTDSAAAMAVLLRDIYGVFRFHQSSKGALAKQSKMHQGRSSGEFLPIMSLTRLVEAQRRQLFTFTTNIYA